MCTGAAIADASGFHRHSNDSIGIARFSIFSHTLNRHIPRPFQFLFEEGFIRAIFTMDGHADSSKKAKRMRDLQPSDFVLR